MTMRRRTRRVPCHNMIITRQRRRRRFNRCTFHWRSDTVRGGFTSSGFHWVSSSFLINYQVGLIEQFYILYTIESIGVGVL